MTVICHEGNVEINLNICKMIFFIANSQVKPICPKLFCQSLISSMKCNWLYVEQDGESEVPPATELEPLWVHNTVKGYVHTEGHSQLIPAAPIADKLALLKYFMA